MKKNPVLVLTAVAIGAVAVVAGLMKDKWLGKAPQAIQELVAATSAEQPVAPPPQGSDAAGAQPTTPAEPQAVAKAPVEPPPAKSDAPGLGEDTPPAAIEQPPVAEQVAPPPEQPAAPAEAEPPKTEQAAATDVAQPPAVEQPAAATGQDQTPATAPAAQQPAAPAESLIAAIEQPVEPAPEEPPATAAEQPPAAELQRVPAFDTVRVEKTGEAVIAGTAAAGAEVVVRLDGVEIGKTTANRDGAFVIIPDKPLPEGSGALTIESRAEGEAVATASDQIVAIVVPAKATQQDTLVAVVSPTAPTRVLQASEPEVEPDQEVAAVQPEATTAAEPAAPKPASGKIRQVSLDAVDYDESGNIVFTGQGHPGNGARIYVDNEYVGEATAGTDGRWAFSGTAEIGLGVHTLRVDGIDASGKVLNRIEVPFFREENKKVAATAQLPADPEVKTDLEQPGEVKQVAEALGENQDNPKRGRVVIQPGNNLWRIAKVLYGDGRKYTMLYEANKGQIRDPDRIYPGQIFATPNVEPPAETVDPLRREPMVMEDGTPVAQ